MLIRENTNLDTSSGRSTHGSSIVCVAIVILVVHLDTPSELRSIHVSIGFHVLNVLALIVTSGGIDIVAHPGIVVVLIVVGVSVVGIGLHLYALLA